MTLLNPNRKLERPVYTGFSKTIIMALLVLLSTTSIVACSDDDAPVRWATPEEPTTETPEENTPEEEQSDVIILDESEIQDYDKFYKPAEFAAMDMLRSDSQWSFVRSKQSEHFIVFWEEGFGMNPNADTIPAGLRVDIDDLLEKVEVFFDENINTLKFAELGTGASNLDDYKMEVYLLYQTEWLATGSGYDDMIGALWVNPSTCQPVGSTIAHEIGHSFQYQTYADLLAHGGISNDFTRGFRYGFGGNGGNAFWEQTAQWQSFQNYPAEAFESYNFEVYMENYHRHINHELHRYASYWIHYYWTDKHGIDFIGKLWREAESPEDPIEAYMRMNSLSVSQMNDELYDAATKFVTWDLDAIRENGANYIGQHTYKLFQLEDNSYQVSYEKCPGTTGYNVIPLNVPEAGTVVSTSFTGLTPGSELAPEDPGQYLDGETTYTTTTYNSSELSRAGWRYGYVALLEDGERVYGDMHSATSADVEFTIPENCQRLWFVVLGAPTTYESHAWDELDSNDDQWPYKLSFSQTDLLGNITIDPNAQPQDLTLSYNLSFPATTGDDYSGTTLSLNANGDITRVAQALSMQPSAISAALLAAGESPAEGSIAFAAVEPSGSNNYSTTANGYGFWYAGDGSVIGWGDDSDLFSEFSEANFEFTIGQFPGHSVAGDQYTIKQAFVYTKDGQEYTVTFEFNVTIN